METEEQRKWRESEERTLLIFMNRDSWKRFDEFLEGSGRWYPTSLEN